MSLTGDIYTKRGYKNRKDYLEQLAKQYEVHEQVVFSLAGALGSTEDFDGLLSLLNDLEADN